MNLQTIISASAAGLAALYFIRGAVLDFRPHRPKGGTCGKCSAGGCPGIRKG